MKVVIGAGPAGLYTAIKLRKAGVLDVVVCDPREGHYTRPGHLNYS
jgi:flavin-dependent dehydrogenase